VKCYSARIYRS